MKVELRKSIRATGLLMVAVALLIAGFQIKTDQASAVTFSGPITISRGGTYSGNWQSLDANVAAVTVTTSEPVIIENSNIRGRGHLILGRAVLNLTVRNTTGLGLNPNIRGREAGRFVTSQYGFTNLSIEHNYLEQTAGIWVYDYRGNFTASNTLKVLDNKAKNIDGRWSDGAGGYLTGSGDNTYVQFVQLDKVRNIPFMEIGWNEVVNEPWNSRVEDNISLYASGGTAASPMLIHDNFIKGAYPVDPVNYGYSGGGIMLGDNATGTLAAGHVNVSNNQIVGTTNYGLQIVCGNDQTLSNNRVLAANVLPDGRQIKGQNVGIAMGSSALWGTACDNYTNATASNNQVGWQRSTGRNDWWTPNATSFTGNTSMTGPITVATEQAEYVNWTNKVGSAGRTVGLTVPSTTLPPSTTTTGLITTTTTAAPTTTTTAAPTTTTTPAPTTTTTVAGAPTTTTTAARRPSGKASTSTYTVAMSSLTPTSASNGFGPYERNMSNGEAGTGDGRTMTLNGVQFKSGLGVHSDSSLTYNLGGRYTSFAATIGVDDEITSGATVTFEVWVDGTRVYASGVMTPTSSSAKVSVKVTGASQIRLVVTNAGDGINFDHADWADARLVK